MSDGNSTAPDSTAITPASGPVAVTGAAGYVGSHIVLNLVKHGYTVRACVRDTSNLHNTAHLSAMNSIGPGTVTLHKGDLTIPGDYDETFSGCSYVFHAAAEMGNLEGSTPMKIYEGCFEGTKNIIGAIQKSASVRRLVYTSSFAAVAHPSEDDYVFTEDSWADMNMEMNPPERQWSMEAVRRDRAVAYAKGKADAERYVYAEAEENGFDAFGVCPCHVIGPLLSASHQRPWTWQTRIGDMIEGYGHPRMYWNIIDVRDVAEAQRLIAECKVNKNGERYNLVATDDSGQMRQTELQEILQKLYPGIGIGGIYRDGKWMDRPRSVLQKVITQLGLKPHAVEETIRDNADSLLKWGLVTTRPGVDNWQHQGNDLGIASKWRPHEYPALDPDAKAKA
jgi:nucleoside-diphosphate-sugar epimerase